MQRGWAQGLATPKANSPDSALTSMYAYSDQKHQSADCTPHGGRRGGQVSPVREAGGAQGRFDGWERLRNADGNEPLPLRLLKWQLRQPRMGDGARRQSSSWSRFACRTVLVSIYKSMCAARVQE